MLTMRQQNDKRHNVHQDKRLIGFILHIGPSAALQAGWRFIPNRQDIAARMPNPATVHDTAGACFAALQQVLSAN